MRKRLTKSRTNVVLTGTLGGIAEYFGVDSTIIRLIYVLIVFAGFGSPILLYIVMALLIPSADRRDDYGRKNPYHKDSYHTNSKYEQKRDRKQAEKVDDDDWSDF